MAWALGNLDVTDGRVRVRSLGVLDFEVLQTGLLARDSDETSIFEKYWGIDTPEQIAIWLQGNLEKRREGRHNPFVYELDGEVAGYTSFLRISEHERTLEIGSTWVMPKHRRSAVNTRVKKQLLKYAFESLNAERVEFRVDIENYRSQMAVLRLGAKFEGRLRSRHTLPTGEVRDGHLYSLVRSDWIKMSAHLDALVGMRNSELGLMPNRISGENIELRRLKWTDAEKLHNLVAANRKDLTEFFPKIGCLTQLVQARALIADREHQAIAETAFYYGIFRGEKRDTLLGQVHAHSIQWPLGTAEIGYWLDSAWRKKGIARQAAKLIIERLKYRKN